MAKQSVALLGLGTMGAGMAGESAQGRFSPLAVYNRSRAKAEAFASQGARVAGYSGRCGTRCGCVIVSMLADDTASRAVWLGPDGAVAAAEKGAVLVDSSTVTPSWIAVLAKAAEARGLEMLDAPAGDRKQNAGGRRTAYISGGRDRSCTGEGETGSGSDEQRDCLPGTEEWGRARR